MVTAFYPTKNWAYIGQTSGILAGLLCFAGGSIRRGGSQRYSDILTGVTTALPAIVKPFYAPVGAHLLRDKKQLLASVGTGVVVVVLSVVIFGIDPMREYIELVTQARGRSIGEFAVPPSQWIQGRYEPWYVLGSVALYLQFAIAGVIAVISFRTRQNPSRNVTEYVFVLGTASTAIVAPSPKYNVLNATIPAILVLFIIESRRTDGLPLIPLVSALLIQVHRWFVKGVVLIADTVQNADVLTVVLPAVQPAFWGVVILVLFSSYRVLVESGQTTYINYLKSMLSSKQ
jgi:hypothetical protein